MALERKDRRNVENLWEEVLGIFMEDFGGGFGNYILFGKICYSVLCFI